MSTDHQSFIKLSVLLKLWYQFFFFPLHIGVASRSAADMIYPDLPPILTHVLSADRVEGKLHKAEQNIQRRQLNTEDWRFQWVNIHFKFWMHARFHKYRTFILYCGILLHFASGSGWYTNAVRVKMVRELSTWLKATDVITFFLVFVCCAPPSALNASSPSMMALNELLKQQLAVTRRFIESSRHQHQSVMKILKPNYRYTTLKETLEVMSGTLSSLTMCILGGLSVATSS